MAALTSLGTGFWLSNEEERIGGSQSAASEYSYGWLVVLSMVAYLFAFGIGMSSVPWTLNAEIYPTHARSLGTSASTTTNWLGNVIISATFLSLAADRALGKAGAFWLYASIGVVGWLWLYGCMPETKGLTLEEIELLFARQGDPPRAGEQIDVGVFTGGVERRQRRQAGGFTLLTGGDVDSAESRPSQEDGHQSIVSAQTQHHNSWARAGGHDDVLM